MDTGCIQGLLGIIANMDYSLNSFKGGYRGDYIVDYHGGFRGDTRILDCGSYYGLRFGGLVSDG